DNHLSARNADGGPPRKVGVHMGARPTPSTFASQPNLLSPSFMPPAAWPASSGGRLPGHASLEQLKKQAKELLAAFRAGDPAAAARFRAVYPQLPERATLTQAQFVIAREYGV